MHKKINGKIEEIKDKYNFIKLPFVYLFIIYSISVFSILRANFNYIDDLERVNKGVKTWGSTFSRYMSDILSTFIHADNYLTDVSPLPQIIAICFLALSGIILIYILTGKKQINLWDLIAVIPIGLSPYFLECFSYKYDSPYIALSVLAAIFPLLFIEYGDNIYLIVVIIGNLLMYTTYQAASGIYPMLVAMLIFKWWNENRKIKEIINFLLYSVLGYVIAFLIFRLFIMHDIVTYVSYSIASFGQMISNYKQYFNYVYTDFKKWWLILIVIIVLCFVYSVVKETKRKRWCSLLFALVTVIVCSLLCFGMYPALEVPLYAPRAMYGFGVLVSIFAVMAVREQKFYFSRIICFCLSWVFIVFTFTYGNALSEQKRYTDFRVQEVLDDLGEKLADAENMGKTVTLQLSGNIGKSPVIKNMPQNYQILERLVPSTFGEGWVWSEYYIYNYFGLRSYSLNTSIDLQTFDLPVISDTLYHTIKGNEDYILIMLK